MRNTKLLSIVVVALVFSCKANFQLLQKDANRYNLTTIEQLQNEEYAQKIEDFYANGKEDKFVGEGNIDIYFKLFKQAKKEEAAILISSGRTEAAIKYKELIFDLYNNGYSIYIHDHRGQGLSGRMTEDPEMGYVDTFQFYVDDMKYFYDHMLKPNKHKKVYLLAHSMGGAIGMTYLEQYPDDFSAAAFSSPMLGLKPPTCTAIKLFTDPIPKYGMGETKYQDDRVAFEDNHLTGSEIRYNRMNEAFNNVPEAKLGGATYQWVHKSCQQFNYLFSNIDKIETPFILLSAQNDQIVDVHAHQKFVEKAQGFEKECKAYVVENAQHELFIEKDEQRIETINEILSFYDGY